MGKIIDLIKNFIEPRSQQTFDELAVASGISEKELKQLKNTMEGIDWNAFAREDEEKAAKKRVRTIKQDQNEIENNLDVHKETSVKKNDDIEIEK